MEIKIQAFEQWRNHWWIMFVLSNTSTKTRKFCLQNCRTEKAREILFYCWLNGFFPHFIPGIAGTKPRHVKYLCCLLTCVSGGIMCMRMSRARQFSTCFGRWRKKISLSHKFHFIRTVFLCETWKFAFLRVFLSRAICNHLTHHSNNNRPLRWLLRPGGVKSQRKKGFMVRVQSRTPHFRAIRSSFVWSITRQQHTHTEFHRMNTEQKSEARKISISD